MTHESLQHPDPTATSPVESRPQGLVSSRLWRHAFGEMLIETRADGTVLIDGKPVTDTLPPSPPGSPGAPGDRAQPNDQEGQ